MTKISCFVNVTVLFIFCLYFVSVQLVFGLFFVIYDTLFFEGLHFYQLLLVFGTGFGKNQQLITMKTTAQCFKKLIYKQFFYRT